MCEFEFCLGGGEETEGMGRGTDLCDLPGHARATHFPAAPDVDVGVGFAVDAFAEGLAQLEAVVVAAAALYGGDGVEAAEGGAFGDGGLSRDGISGCGQGSCGEGMGYVRMFGAG